MKITEMLWLILFIGLSALIASGFYDICYGDEAGISYGVGIFHDADSFLGQNKYIDINYRHFVYQGVYIQSKLGGLGEGGPDQTRKGGGFIAQGAGLEVDLKPIELRGGGSLAAITTPDSQLGSVFPQFNEDIAIGFRDKKEDGIAVQYNHISCASFCSPNAGRDFILFELSLKW